jgi:ABC-type cobalamin/Fe3+-siderophores transport system ATPase subunit
MAKNKFESTIGKLINTIWNGQQTGKSTLLRTTGELRTSEGTVFLKNKKLVIINP